MTLACRFGVVHVVKPEPGTAPIEKKASAQVKTAPIVRAHQNLRGDHTQASVPARNRDGG